MKYIIYKVSDNLLGIKLKYDSISEYIGTIQNEHIIIFNSKSDCILRFNLIKDIYRLETFKQMMINFINDKAEINYIDPYFNSIYCESIISKEQFFELIK